MSMADPFFALAAALAEQMGRGELRAVQPLPMEPGEEEYSGAKLVRLRCVYAGGETGSFVCKYTSPAERAALHALTEQGRGYTPRAYSGAAGRQEDGWCVMEDVRPCEPVPRSLSWTKQVAAALAGVHTDNLAGGGGRALPLPHAEEAYWVRVTTALSVDHFERQCAEDGRFAAEYGSLLPRLRRRGERFVQDMTALCREGTSLTLTHGDLQDREGDHVRCRRGRPMILDWGFTRYAPFYIDLVDYFTQEEAFLYWEEMRCLGLPLSRSDFAERFRLASAYPGFIYLYPALASFRRGSAEKLNRLLSLLCGD